MNSLPRPRHRADFNIAIVCALKTEFNAVTLLFDQFWDDCGDPYGKLPGDRNTYATGRVGNHNVVLVLLPGMGKVNAASASAGIAASYSEVRLTLIVGICGGVPKDLDGNDIFLGDVIISESVVQYDLGRQYPDEFQTKEGLLDRLGKPNKEILTFVKTLQTGIYLERLLARGSQYLGTIQNSPSPSNEIDRTEGGGRYEYPGPSKDKLFQPTYWHKHNEGCNICNLDTSACQESRKLSCSELHCNEKSLARQREFNIGEVWKLAVHFGVIASGDSVIKSGEDRDNRARNTNAIAFEMEGAGVWDTTPCIIVKGVCDYADSHKQNEWQNFAAATAASVAKALLELNTLADNVLPSINHYFEVPTIEENTAGNVASQSNSISAPQGRISHNKARVFGRQQNYIGPPSPSAGYCVLL